MESDWITIEPPIAEQEVNIPSPAHVALLGLGFLFRDVPDLAPYVTIQRAVLAEQIYLLDGPLSVPTEFPPLIPLGGVEAHPSVSLRVFVRSDAPATFKVQVFSVPWVAFPKAQGWRGLALELQGLGRRLLGLGPLT